MTTYLVTGASGHLGRLAVHALLERGVAASDVVATARNTDSIADLAALGVATRTADYSDPTSLRAAFVGVDRALLVSSSAVGERVAQHANVIDAARDAGVELLGYTSITRADTSQMVLADEHRATEELLAASGLGRLAESLLYQLKGSDPVVLVASAIALTLVALAAGFVPAQRASRVDPMRALRYE